MKKILPLTLLATVFLGACFPLLPAVSSGEKPTPVIETQAVDFDEPSSVSRDIFPTFGYQPVVIDDVEVEVGVGSPIPVFVHIGGNLPDVCAQVEYVELVQNGSKFIVKVGTIASTTQECIPDTLPFRMSLPLNILDLPVGSYTVEVNGVSADFSVDASASTATDLRTPAMPIYKDDTPVDDVTIEFGVGSPRPVHAVVSANLPKSCGQLGEVQMHRADKTFFVRLIGHLPAQSECNPDTLPLRLEIPLNIVNLPEGIYEVNVNGTTTTFELPVK